PQRRLPVPGRAFLARAPLARPRSGPVFVVGRGPFVGGDMQIRAVVVERRLPACVCCSLFRRHHATRPVPGAYKRRSPKTRQGGRVKGPLSCVFRLNRSASPPSCPAIAVQRTACFRTPMCRASTSSFHG